MSDPASDRRTTIAQTLGNLLMSVCGGEEGAVLVEYILLAMLIGAAATAGMVFLGRASNNSMNNVATTVHTLPG